MNLRSNLLFLLAGVLVFASACGARTTLPAEESDPDDAPAGPTVVESGNCAKWGAWTDVGPGATPQSLNSPQISCAKTCQEKGAARLTIFCEGSPGILSECYFLIGDPGHPEASFGYATCSVAAFGTYDDNDTAACARRFAEDPAGLVTEYRTKAASPECAPAP